MGFQTNISILNDHFDWIEKNPETFVKAIKYGMNSGTNSPTTKVSEAERAAEKDEPYYNPYGYTTDEEQEARSHYVTVHKAHHADDVQMIVSHGNSAADVYDFGWAIRRGLLDLDFSSYEVRYAKRLIEQLRDAASYLEESLKQAGRTCPRGTPGCNRTNCSNEPGHSCSGPNAPAHPDMLGGPGDTL